VLLTKVEVSSEFRGQAACAPNSGIHTH